MELRLLMAVGAVATATAGSVFAITIDPIGWRQNGGANVPEGTTQTVTAPMIVGDGGTFIKAGAGTLEMPISALDKYHTGDVDHVVLNGTLKLTSDQVSTPALTAPACFAKASQWFSAMDTSFLVTAAGGTPGEGDDVHRWLDVRETNKETPTRPFMQHKQLKTDGTTDCPQTLVTAYGHNAVYGGGSAGNTAGVVMELLNPNGSARNERYVYAMFMVHGVKDCFGTMLGSRTDPNDFFTGSAGAPLAVPTTGYKGYFYFRGDSMSPSLTGRHYRNGQLFDPFTSYITRTNEVIGAHFCDRVTSFSLMFGHRESTNGRCGGDYLYEAVVFTNQLTDAEVEEVNSYLVRKYNLEVKPKTQWTIGVAEGGKVEITKTCDSSEEKIIATNYLPFVFKGEGTVVKRGSNVLSLRAMAFEDFNGVFKLSEGSVLSRFDELFPMLPESGKQYEAKHEITGNRAQYAPSSDFRCGTKTTVSTGTAGTITKIGSDELAVVGIPEGTKKVEVNAGTLTLIPREMKKVYASGDTISAVFADPGVENEQLDFPPSATNKSRRKNIGKGATVGGWTCPAGTQGSVSIAVAPLIYDGSSFNFEIVEGNQAITLLNPATGGTSEIYTTVNFPAAGTYRVSWREARGSLGDSTLSHAYHVMFGKTWAEAVEVDHRIAADGFYPRVYMMLTVPEAGEYCFGFMVDDVCGGKYYNVTMDDFRADYVVKPSAVNVVKIPNGDFEKVYTNNAPEILSANGASEARLMDNHAVGWTFHQGDAIDKLPSVSVASPAIPAQIVQRSGGGIRENATVRRFSRLADETYGTFSLFMAYIFKNGKVDRGGNNYATTTFTVDKAGTYYLRGKVTRWSMSYDSADFLGQLSSEIPSVKATVTVGGADNELGALAGSSHLQKDRYWATPFTVAEDNTEVTLKIEQTVKGAIGLVDDLVLVKAVGGVADDPVERDKNYITNGSFEEGSEAIVPTDSGNYTAKSWTTLGTAQGYNDGISFWVKGTVNGGQYTADPYDGRCVCCVRGNAVLYQTLPAMKAGKYRFRVAANTRFNKLWCYNGFEARLVKGNSTNVICRIENVYDDEPRVHYYDFNVPEDGTYQLNIQGTAAVTPAWASGTISCVVDGLSIKRVFDEEMVLPEVPANTKITVASGAKLKLDFDGSIDVGTVTLGGTKVYGGEISKTTHPDFIEGDGKLYVTTSNKGMLLLIR